MYLYNPPELFDFESDPKQVGIGTTIGRTGNRQEITNNGANMR